VRWVVLLLDVCWRQVAEGAAVGTVGKRPEERSPLRPRARGRKRVA
jgi:hypothetical protein